MDDCVDSGFDTDFMFLSKAGAHVEGLERPKLDFERITRTEGKTSARL